MVSARNSRDVSAIVGRLGRVWVSLKEYRDTHGYAHLLLADDDSQQVANIYLSDCYFISGPTSGGPWEVRVAEMSVHGETHVELSAGEGKLVLKGLRIEVVVAAEDSVSEGIDTVRSFGIHEVIVAAEDEFVVTGRCYEGPLVIGDVFRFLYELDAKRYVKSEMRVALKVVRLEAYGRQFAQAESGLTVAMSLTGTGGEKLKERLVLSQRAADYFP